MPRLRRPHDHHRNLRARRRTACPAIIPSRGQDRDAMMAVVTSSHRSPTGGRFRCRSSVAPWPRNADAMPPITPEIALSKTAAETLCRLQSSIHHRLPRPAHHSRAPPRRQIAIDGHRPRRPPRVPSLQAFGRRPSAPVIGRDGPASETLHDNGHSWRRIEAARVDPFRPFGRSRPDHPRRAASCAKRRSFLSLKQSGIWRRSPRLA
jgi:hypothetical protein